MLFGLLTALCAVYIDVLELEQHADVILAAYPYVFYVAGSK